MSKSLKLSLVVILVVLGALALATGVVYLVVPFRHLPSFIPGHKPGYGAYHQRGAIGIVIGLVLLAVAGLIGRVSRRSRSSAALTSAHEPSEAPSLPAEEGASA